MDILVIGENIEKQTLWKELLEDTSSLKIKSRLDLASSVKYSAINHRLLICLNINLDKFESMIVDKSIASNIPVIYVIDEISKEEYISLLEKGIKGVINSDMSLESIKESIQIVAEGGVYINPPYKNIQKKNRVQTITPELNIDEWEIYSLTDKGFEVPEISELLKIREEKVRGFQKLLNNRIENINLQVAIDD